MTPTCANIATSSTGAEFYLSSSLCILTWMFFRGVGNGQAGGIKNIDLFKVFFEKGKLL